MPKVLLVVVLAWTVGMLRAEPTGCPDFEVEAPRVTDGPVVRAADFGVSEANAEKDACLMEHILSAETMERMQEFLDTKKKAGKKT